jgi:predicted small lipoprotein YifL
MEGAFVAEKRLRHPVWGAAAFFLGGIFMKKLLAILLTLAMVLSLAACVTTNPLPEEQLPQKPGDNAPTSANPPTGELTETAKRAFKVTVVHADGTSKDFSYETDAEKLGDFLEAQGLISSEGADEGMFHTVDGEQAIYETDKAYWAFYEGEDYAMTGIYDTAIADGATYKLVYTPA